MISDFEREILTRTDVAKPEGMGYPTVAYITWVSQGNRVQMGRVRWAFGPNDTGRETLTVSASPFPGAWVYVDEADILVVRHPEAMQ